MIHREITSKKIAKTFADYVMFQNSGAEATEAAIKLLEDIFIQQENQIKTEFCALKTLHGRTLATIYASGSKMTEGFGPKVNRFDHFNFGDTYH